MGAIRFLLALSVVLGHFGAPVRLGPGDSAVQAFFAISGFYMAMVYQEKYHNLPVTTFYSNRYLRLFPSYAIVLVSTAALGVIFGSFPTATLADMQWLAQHGSPGTLFAVAFSNLTMIFQDVFLLLGIDPASGRLVFEPRTFAAEMPSYRYMLVPQAWSIGSELLFYLLVPLLAKRSTLFIALTIAVSVMIRASSYYLFYFGEPWTYRFTPSEFLNFGTGMILYRLYVKYGAMRSFKVFSGPALTFCIGIHIIYPYIPSYLYVFNTGSFAFQPSSSTLFSIIVVLATPFIFHATRNNRVDRWIGELSYPLYINHFFVALFCIFVFGWRSPILLTIVAIAAAGLLVVLVERPLDRFRQRRLTARDVVVPAAALPAR